MKAQSFGFVSLHECNCPPHKRSIYSCLWMSKHNVLLHSRPHTQTYWSLSGSRLLTPSMGKWQSSRKSKMLYDWRSVSKLVCLGIEHPCGTCDQILLPIGMLLSENCCRVYVGRPLWREDGCAVCSAITRWSESRRTVTILYCLIWDSPKFGFLPASCGDSNRAAT
jgi:hypothetical protein